MASCSALCAGAVHGHGAAARYGGGGVRQAHGARRHVRTAQGQRAGAPFELCYSSQALVTTRIGYQVPYTDRPDAGEREELDAGAGQHLGGERGRHRGDTACFTFVEMKGDVDAMMPRR